MRREHFLKIMVHKKRHVYTHFFLGFVLSYSAFAVEKPHPCQISYISSNSAYKLTCGKEEQVFKISVDEKLSDSYQKLKDAYLSHSENKTTDEAYLKEMVLSQLENDLKFRYIGDEAMISRGLKEFESLITGPTANCEEKVEAPEVTPFVDLSLKQETRDELIRKMSDLKMREEGFINLGEFKSLSVDLRTDNDNLLSGVGKMISGAKPGAPREWWEGDDRGYTFGESLELKFDFKDGHVRAKQYTEGYSILSSVLEKVTVCDNNGNCKDTQVVRKRDSENKRYQNFLTIDGLELEIRKNFVNNDFYVKLGGSVERLTDSDTGLAQRIQTAWHKLKEKQGTVQYHNLDHMQDGYRGQIISGIGLEKSHQVANWASVKGAIEGSIQGSTDGLENSFVALRAEMSVDSNQLLRKDSSKPPLAEAKFYAQGRQYGDNKTYVQAGVTLYGNIYSDEEGNIVSLYAGTEKFDNPSSRRYGVAEVKERQRADLNHILGIKFQGKF